MKDLSFETTGSRFVILPTNQTLEILNYPLATLKAGKVLLTQRSCAVWGGGYGCVSRSKKELGEMQPIRVNYRQPQWSRNALAECK